MGATPSTCRLTPPAFGLACPGSRLPSAWDAPHARWWIHRAYIRGAFAWLFPRISPTMHSVSPGSFHVARRKILRGSQGNSSTTRITLCARTPFIRTSKSKYSFASNAHAANQLCHVLIATKILTPKPFEHMFINRKPCTLKPTIPNPQRPNDSNICSSMAGHALWHQPHHARGRHRGNPAGPHGKTQVKSKLLHMPGPRGRSETHNLVYH